MFPRAAEPPLPVAPVVRQDPRAGGWAGPQLPLSKLLDPLAPYSVRQVLRVPFTPRPPASLPLSLRLLGAAPPGAGSGWVARTGERAQVWVGLEAEAADGAEVVIMVVEANVAPSSAALSALRTGLGQLSPAEMPNMCPQKSCMRSSNSHLVAPGAEDAALRAALRYMRIDPWLDPAATSDKVKLSLLRCGTLAALICAMRMRAHAVALSPEWRQTSSMAWGATMRT